MKARNLVLIGASIFAIASESIAEQPPSPVVALHYTIRENDPEKLEKTVTIRVERAMQKLERVAQTKSSTSHGTVDVEIGFQGEATEEDLATVTAQIDRLNLDSDVAVISRTIELRPPRLPSYAAQKHH